LGARQEPRQGAQRHPVGRLQIGAVYLPAEHGDLMAKDQKSDVLGSAVAGELGRHLQ
jgi:hypothetical protein